MSIYQKIFEVANPSPYERSDYVQIDLNALQVPGELDEKSLTLCRLDDDGGKQEIPYQIDYPFGEDVGMRTMTFLSAKTPPGKQDDYNEKAAAFLLKETQPKQVSPPTDLLIDLYYKNPKAGEPVDGWNLKWDPSRDVAGVKLHNNALEVYFSLVSASSPKGLPYSGAATSVFFRQKKGQLPYEGEMLCSYDPKEPEKLWGQLRELVFYPLPWEHKWFLRIPLLDKEYKLVWSKCGPIRAVTTFKSQPLTITYEGEPFFEGTKKVKAHLYRVIYVYPSDTYLHPDDNPNFDNPNYKPFYIEELYVLTEKEHKYLSFRPYFFSKVPPAIPNADFKRFDHIPDYFTIWKHLTALHYGYGFAADVHIARVKSEGDEINWRLYLNRNCRCVHYFMFEPFPAQFDPFHAIGHFGWYERVFKPLRPRGLSIGFPSPLESIEYPE